MSGLRRNMVACSKLSHMSPRSFLDLPSKLLRTTTIADRLRCASVKLNRHEPA